VDFRNESPWEAELVRSVLSPDESEPLLAICVVKITYDILPDGSLRLSEEQLPVATAPEDSDLGWVPSDAVPRKPAFDVLVLGHARDPGGRPVPSMTVRLQVGKATRDLAVFGDRVWRQEENGIRATEPEPFEEMPLTYERAYGGTAEALGYETPYAWNPGGKGYVLEEKYADGSPLPNVEDPEARIASWSDQPTPAGFAPVPLASLFTVDRGVEISEDRSSQRVKPDVFQAAHPRLVFPDVPPDTRIWLHGMGPEGRLGFAMPRIEARVEASFDDERYPVEGRVDTLCILADEARCFVLHRSPFKYRMVPEQLRVTTLHVDDAGAPPP
jgi:hypothetical protein